MRRCCTPHWQPRPQAAARGVSLGSCKFFLKSLALEWTRRKFLHLWHLTGHCTLAYSNNCLAYSNKCLAYGPRAGAPSGRLRSGLSMGCKAPRLHLHYIWPRRKPHKLMGLWAGRPRPVHHCSSDNDFESWKYNRLRDAWVFNPLPVAINLMFLFKMA
jgi:hypothetical protein